jgi:hypothetical protein
VSLPLYCQFSSLIHLYGYLWCSLFHFDVYLGILWLHLFVFMFSHIFYFCCLGISWVPPLHFGWPCLVTSLWNSHWLLAEFLLSGCSCGPHWVPWYSLSLFCWSLDLAVCFLHFPLNPVLI